jgi:hypothetical protein
MKEAKSNFKRYNPYSQNGIYASPEFDIQGLFDNLFTPPAKPYEGWTDDAWEEYQRIVKIYKKNIALDASFDDDSDD